MGHAVPVVCVAAATCPNHTAVGAGGAGMQDVRSRTPEHNTGLTHMHMHPSTLPNMHATQHAPTRHTDAHATAHPTRDTHPHPRTAARSRLPHETRAPTRLAEPRTTSRIGAHVPDRRVRTAACTAAAIPLNVLHAPPVQPLPGVGHGAGGPADGRSHRRVGRATTARAPLRRVGSHRRRAAGALGTREQRLRQLHAVAMATHERAHSRCCRPHGTAARRAKRAASRSRQRRPATVAISCAIAPRSSADDGQDLEELAAQPLLLERGRALGHLGRAPSPRRSRTPRLLWRRSRHISSSTTRWAISSPRSLCTGGVVVMRCRWPFCRGAHRSVRRGVVCPLPNLEVGSRKKAQAPNVSEKPSISNEQPKDLDVAVRSEACRFLRSPAM